MKKPLPETKTALIVAHPGHELRVHAWLERTRPLVFVLTDGSGHTDTGRLASTDQVLRQAGTRYEASFEALSDRAAYQLILQGQVERIASMISQIVDRLAETETDVIVSDAIEGFNPVHDLCHVIADGVASRLERQTGRSVQRLDFLLEGSPRAGSHPDRVNGDLRIELSDEMWERKLAAAWAYEELRPEVERGFSSYGPEAFRCETLRPVDPNADLQAQVGAKPQYEIHGEKRVEDGFYDDVLRFQEHFLPLAKAVRAWATGA